MSDGILEIRPSGVKHFVLMILTQAVKGWGI
jgi:hypothetical protein